ncbi:hypothetical protein R3W88_001103 [Solanum pinnatisectum]|uniref:Retrotransposon gag domain-containing protein n=1 Tax=Solanum pinnatisectum TaxID=50273 RepID=A0AAV9MHJ9_9SOLN|nr:hypothetical protein R3W88_001103 [Solanum pinnatisectum]
MTEMYEAWMCGQAPSPSIRDYLNTNMSPPIQVLTNDPIYPPGFGPYAHTSNVAGTSTPTMVPKSNNDPSSQVLHDHGYTPKEALKIPSSYPHTYQYSSLVEAEKVIKNEEHEEMTRKMKSLEQSIKKYDGHGDHVSHLKRNCNQLIGAGSKEELLMAYFGKSLMGITSEWFTDQDSSNWHTWDDLARCFVQQFQYNIDIVLDCISLSNMRKKTTKIFCEYAIRWREQAARVKPLMKESKTIDVFLQAQEPDYFHYLLFVV